MPTSMAQVQGHCSERFQEVASLFQQFLDSGEEIGASITVNVDGEEVINLWGGYANEDRNRPWTENTIVPVASSTKMVSSLAVLMLIDGGAISVNDKVSKYWPEFAANGKENVEIRHLLSHTSGVAGWDDKITMEEVCDVGPSTAKLAGQAPWWEPGTASAYHAWNFGHLLGEIVRRVTGLSLKQFVAERITGPLGADFQIGLLEESWPRVSEFIAPPPPATAPDFTPGPLFMKAIGNPIMPSGFGKTLAWRNGEVGASNGYGNAHALNTILSTITLAGSENLDENKRLLSKSTVDLIFDEQSRGIDLVVGVTLRFGIGYALRGEGDTWVDGWFPKGKIAYWGGSGGSLGLMDVDRQVTITYAMNKRSNNPIGNTASKAYVEAIYKALGVEVK
ncbi:beta-lactamase/transpeptidase-like protein [Pseudomassariella vexata]|uniref:Beta-lactamase/transpeptidase-like protein n=1 Tax=Pseudomassariella vexata TaxID=1141098 RepID=A0A1Y2E7N1_9PEZI|nr:beta-lactamase/transpeptidase-like protein [Pseudomassariella vexata]ORY67549.1 beta-lactamase/transpeptidase-like protein [Pseudomassariella vexata]